MTEGAETDGYITWLHITDLHAGMNNQDWLWPTLKTSFYEDLTTLRDVVGPIDLVIFSGDLTQTGGRDDYDRLDGILTELWAHFGKLNCSPSLIAIPGNHDVKWPDKLGSAHQVLKQWWSIPTVHAEFFANADNEYRAAVCALLSEFTAWQDRLSDAGFPLLKPSATGLLPGDQSFILKKGGLTAGFILLNSTWLQIDDDEYQGKLHVDARQLQKITDDSPESWCAGHDLNLIISHHPVDWLHSDSVPYWESEIYPPNRFDAHLYGHMHSPAMRALASGGGTPRRSVQGASLFGLRTVRNELERIHGYSLGRAARLKDHLEVRAWPRIVTPKQDGSKPLGRDQVFNLRESDGSYLLVDKKLTGTKDGGESEGGSGLAARSTSLEIPTNSDDILKKVRHHLPLQVAHLNVRRVEQQRCVDALNSRRAVWLVSSWGMGDDGFLSSVRHARGHSSSPAFQIDLSDFTSRDQMFDGLKLKLGCSIERFTDILSNAGIVYVVFDDFPVSDPHADDTVDQLAGMATNLEEIIGIILEFCPQLNAVIKTRRAPSQHLFPVVEIGALDPADLKAYILDHEKGGPDRATTSTVTALHRHTDGIPTRVDQALKHLSVVTLPELLSSNTDLMVSMPVGGRFHPALLRSLKELSEAADNNQKRVYSLLKALMIFPQGEQLSRIKRFYLNAPFHLHHAEELLDRTLIEVTTMQRIENAALDTQARTLVVPRQTRDCLRHMMEADEFRTLNQKAAELYFGDRWRSGTMKPNASYRFDHPDCSSGDIENASTIIVRLYADAIENADERDIVRSLGLAHSYLGALLKGDHFTGAVNFSERLIPQIDEEVYSDHRANLMADYGRALRMKGEKRAARDVLLQVCEHQFPSATRQVVLVNLALCYQTLREEEDARHYAQQALAIDKHTIIALQAQSIILELDPDKARRDKNLIAHETKCRRRNAHVVANNIALDRARSSSNRAEVQRILEPVMRITPENKDHYNQTRGIIELSKASLKSESGLADKEMGQLMDAYYFLFNEQLPSLFDSCHEALWDGLAFRSDVQNLTRLFRYSSLYWRLRSREDTERRYIGSLIDEFGSKVMLQETSTEYQTKEAAYLSSRAKAMGMLSGPSTLSLANQKSMLSG